MDCEEAWAGLTEVCDSWQPRLTWNRRGSVVECSSSFWFWSLECYLGCDTCGSKQISAKPQNIFNYRKSNMISAEHHKPAESWVKHQRLSEMLTEVLAECLGERAACCLVLLSMVPLHFWLALTSEATPLPLLPVTPNLASNASEPGSLCFKTITQLTFIGQVVARRLLCREIKLF